MPWVKGQSGNAKGRPKKGNSVSEMMKKLLSGREIDPITGRSMSRKEMFCLAVFKAALSGNSAAMRLVWERMDGLLTTDSNQEDDLTNVQVILQKLNDGMKKDGRLQA